MRAYSILMEKSFKQEDGFVTIEGIASTPTADKMGDIVEPMGAQFKTPMPLLLQHSHDQPVGHVTFARPTIKGIPFRAQIPVVTEPGVIRDRTEEAIHSLKYGLISAVSIGFQAIEGEVERLKSGGVRFKRWLWHELSLVTVPANSDAVITAVKSLDTSAAGGKKDVSGVQLSGGSGNISAHAGAVQLVPRK
jgi:HK97 family phage prohead protease